VDDSLWYIVYELRLFHIGTGKWERRKAKSETRVTHEESKTLNSISDLALKFILSTPEQSTL